jgi:SAM-dependent methyltransferase
MFKELHGGKLFLGLIHSPQYVLELGTGTGIWAMEFADAHPESTVLGVDLSPIQPDWVPPNCSFTVFNYEDQWTFRHPFDYIFSRQQLGSVKNSDRLLQQAFTSLNPGGVIEIQAPCLPTSDDNTIPEGSSYREWINCYRRALEQAGRDPDLARKYEQKLEAAGFIDVDIVMDKIPQNGWPQDKQERKVGLYNQMNVQKALEGLSLRLFVEYLRWDPARLRELLAEVEKDINDTSIHAFWPL